MLFHGDSHISFVERVNRSSTCSRLSTLTRTWWVFKKVGVVLPTLDKGNSLSGKRVTVDGCFRSCHVGFGSWRKAAFIYFQVLEATLPVVALDLQR